MDRIPVIRRAILAEVPFAKGALWSAVAIAAPTLLRWVIDKGEAGVPFLTFFPFVLGAALLLGWRWGSLVALGSAVIANRVFSEEPLLDSFQPGNWILAALFVLSCAALIAIGEAARRLVREMEAAKARETLLNQELMHRVKNMFATVNALVMLTARHSEPENFSRALTGRMRALDRATSVLGVDAARQCDLAMLVEGAIEAFRGKGSITVSGPPCRVPRDSCVPLSLALHELCTNAARHGALSVPEGHVELGWELCEASGAAVLALDWRERGGPPVPEQRGAGMGTQLLRPNAGLHTVEVRFAPEGVTCRIEIEGVEVKA